MRGLKDAEFCYRIENDFGIDDYDIANMSECSHLITSFRVFLFKAFCNHGSHSVSRGVPVGSLGVMNIIYIFKLSMYKRLPFEPSCVSMHVPFPF